MRWELKLFYWTIILIASLIISLGIDSLYPPEKQVFFFYTGNPLLLSTVSSFILLLAGSCLLAVAFAGIWADLVPELKACPSCNGKNKDPRYPDCWHCLDCKWVNCAQTIIGN